MSNCYHNHKGPSTQDVCTKRGGMVKAKTPLSACTMKSLKASASAHVRLAACTMKSLKAPASAHVRLAACTIKSLKAPASAHVRLAACTMKSLKAPASAHVRLAVLLHVLTQLTSVSTAKKSSKMNNNDNDDHQYCHHPVKIYDQSTSTHQPSRLRDHVSFNFMKYTN